MAILLIGPSGVGKSSALEYAARSLDKCRLASLDRLTLELARERSLIGESGGINALRQLLQDGDVFLRLGIDAVERMVHEDGGLVVVDVGAGFLDAPSAGAWFSRHTLVALMASPQVVYRRIVQARADSRSLAEYAAQEFSGRRRALYGRAVYTVNADCPSVEELGARLLKLLIGLVSCPE